MRRMHRLLPVVLLWLMLLPISRAQGEASPVEQARQSVARLYGMGTDAETGARARWAGTGFAVGTAGEDSDIFLTNWHVATGGEKYADDRVELWLLRDNAKFDSQQRPLPGTAVKCRVLITTDGYPDVAVIQAMEPVEGYKALPLLSSRRAADGTGVYALGFSGLSGSEADGPSVTSGEIRGHLVMARADNTSSLIHTAALRPGFSGGPLINAQGAVVAQNTYGFAQDVSTDLFCAVSIDYGMELLDRLNIPYTTVKGSPAIVVQAANLFHQLHISPVPASVTLASGAVLLAAFVLYFTKTARVATAGRKKRRAARRAEKETGPHEN